ncbi:MAG: hypothetical protein F4129_00040, partial [Acidimicrobiia bacterium]|nr:hypothetical protein [Acidimicrobiia bacterium]
MTLDPPTTASCPGARPAPGRWRPEAARNEAPQSAWCVSTRPGRVSRKLSHQPGSLGLMLVMGIDPGLSRCGYGVIRQKGRAIEAIAAGIIRTDKDDSIPRRLFELQNELVDLMGTYSPDAVAIEQVLFQVNVRTAMG